jgi:hypothetical protein
LYGVMVTEHIDYEFDYILNNTRILTNFGFNG